MEDLTINTLIAELEKYRELVGVGGNAKVSIDRNSLINFENRDRYPFVTGVCVTDQDEVSIIF
ncbi:hypothetical protein [Sphingobacterium detergens]|uniref:hypothetical protein n=1 Tax=Sphingobacterium detergens TaxID=1145106 RepID=UPI003AB015DC